MQSEIKAWQKKGLAEGGRHGRLRTVTSLHRNLKRFKKQVSILWEE